MRTSPRFHPDVPTSQPAGGRLNLLLSCADAAQTQGRESWTVRLTRMLEPMGVTAHHASTGRAAQDLIRSTTIHMAVVDLALPLDGQSVSHACGDEGGWRLLELMSRLEQRPPVVAVKRARTKRDEARELNCALRMGAVAVIDRPKADTDAESLLEVLRRVVTKRHAGRWPGMS